MTKRKILICLILSLFISFSLLAEEKKVNVVASTSWTASFAELSGIDDVTVIAPSSLRHPPEYEITVNDVLSISNSDYFIYAGFERMMKTLDDTLSSSNTVPIQIKCDNSFETVSSMARKISKIVGTEEECEKRIKNYQEVLEKGREEVINKGLNGLKVLCHKHQVFLAKELGLNVVETFGTEEVSAKQIVDAKNKGYDIIIDNIHNPVASPLVEVSPNALYVVWRNFPETVMDNSLIKMVSENIKSLTK